MTLQEMFEKIKKYHKTLGYDYYNISFEKRMQDIRNYGLALHQEVAELVNSFPWKPWRGTIDQPWDTSNAKEEIIDCLFFLGSIMEAAGIDSEDIEIIFNEKLLKNYSRIKRNYNNKPEERG